MANLDYLSDLAETEAQEEAEMATGAVSTERLETLGQSAPEVPTSILEEIMGPRARAVEPISRKEPKKVMYWRMWSRDQNHSRHNWISVGPTNAPNTAVEYQEFMSFKDAIPLGEEWGTDYTAGKGNIGMARGETRFHSLLSKPNAINLFPESQIVAYGWHRLASVRAARTDIDFSNYPDIQCEFCPRVFASTQGYTRHLTAMHNDSAQASNMATQMIKVLEAQGNNSNLDVEMLAQVVAATITAYENNKQPAVEKPGENQEVVVEKE